MGSAAGKGIVQAPFPIVLAQWQWLIRLQPHWAI